MDEDKDETLGIAIIPEYEMCKEELCEAGTQKKIDIPSFESYILNVLGCSITEQSRANSYMRGTQSNCILKICTHTHR